MDPAGEKARSMFLKQLLLAAAITLVALSLLPVTLFLFICLAFSGPSQAKRFGDSHHWQGGVVELYDYCWHPGTYDTYVEWRDSQGARKKLVHVGDDWPRVRVLESGDLEVTYTTYLDFEGRQWKDVTIVLSNPDEKHVLSETLHSATKVRP